MDRYFRKTVRVSDFVKNSIVISDGEWPNPIRSEMATSGCFIFRLKDACLFISQSGDCCSASALKIIKRNDLNRWVCEYIDELPKRDEAYIDFYPCEKSEVEELKHHLQETCPPVLDNEGGHLVGECELLAKEFPELYEAQKKLFYFYQHGILDLKWTHSSVPSSTELVTDEFCAAMERRIRSLEAH